MKATASVLVLLLALALPAGATGFDHRHAEWDRLLEKYVTWNDSGTASRIDYAGFQSDRKVLQSYLDTLSAVSRRQFDNWNRDRQLAFLINAYNAFTVELILRHYPGIESIRELGGLFSSPWEKRFLTLFGKKRHLDWLEHDLIRGAGQYNEPLIHFAVNCASIGCPALLDEAYRGETLDDQLLDATRRFLEDRSRNYYEHKEDTLHVSSIFKWYEEDFSRGWRGYDSLKDFFANHAAWLSDEKSVRQKIVNKDFGIEFLPYDWSLNGG